MVRSQWTGPLSQAQQPPLAPVRVAAPILAIASKRESPDGETAERLEAWAELTRGGFELAEVDEGHMEAMTSEQLRPLLSTAWTPTMHKAALEASLPH